MKEFLATLDWGTIITTIWTVILLPLLATLGNQVKNYLYTKKLDKYADMLYKSAEIVVRDLQESVVKDIKNTDEWTDERIEEIKQEAINKTIASISYEGYQILKEANSDFDNWVDSIIQAKLYDLKNK